MIRKAFLFTFMFLVGLKNIQAKPQTKPKLETRKTYENTLKYYTLWKDNLSNPNFYKNFSLKNGKTFADFTEFEKDQFYLVQCVRMEMELRRLDDLWKYEIKCLNSVFFRRKMTRETATAKEVTEFRKKLFELRKEVALNLESLAETLFKKHKDKISKKEIDYLRKKIRSFHNRSGLVKKK